MAYYTVFSYRGVPSGLFTKEMNSRNTPSRPIRLQKGAQDQPVCLDHHISAPQEKQKWIVKFNRIVLLQKLKNPPKSQDFDGFWSEWGDSNSRHLAPKQLEKVF